MRSFDGGRIRIRLDWIFTPTSQRAPRPQPTAKISWRESLKSWNRSDSVGRLCVVCEGEENGNFLREHRSTAYYTDAAATRSGNKMANCALVFYFLVVFKIVARGIRVEKMDRTDNGESRKGGRMIQAACVLDVRCAEWGVAEKRDFHKIVE